MDLSHLLDRPQHSHPSPSAGEFNLLRISRRAMATSFEIAIPQGFPNAIAAAEAALDLIDDLEQQMTIYREDSDISLLNCRAGGEAVVVVEDRLFELLQLCTAWTAATEGAFDIATGSLIQAWGFHRRKGRIPTARELQLAMAATGSKHLILDAANHSVRYRVPGLEINLGAVGKGYALDRAAELLKNQWGVESALLHAGGSSVFAIGHPPGEPRGWPIQIAHPTREGESIATIWLCDRGFGTSAATFQYFVYNGTKLGHLLDPRTGWPAEGTESASVAAPTAAEADAMSTALFVLGASGADRLLKVRHQLSGVILPTETATHSSWIGSEVETGF